MRFNNPFIFDPLPNYSKLPNKLLENEKSHLINKKSPNLYFLLFTLQITNEYVFGTLEFYLSVCFVIEIQENLLNDFPIRILSEHLKNCNTFVGGFFDVVSQVGRACR